jgi:hypothetical protein
VHLIACATAAPSIKAESLPSLCSLDEENYSRFSDCLYEGWFAEVVNQQGQVLGTVSGSTAYWNTLSYKLRTWTEKSR